MAFPGHLQEGLARRHLTGLDAFRAVAALLVVFYHGGVPYVSGGLGVLLFFVLSGFLITWLMIQENDATGTVSLRNFYIRRALRIFPAFYVYTAIVLGYAQWRGRPIVWPQAMASMLYVNNYYQALFGDPNTGLSHTWSLAIEEQFYLLWPLLFLIVRGDYQSARRYLMVAIGAVWLRRAYLVFVAHATSGYLYEAFDARADHLLIGCLLAVALRTGSWNTLWTVVSGRSWAAGLVAFILAASSVVESRFGEAYRDTAGAIVNPLLAAVLIAQIISLHGSKVGTIMEHSWFRYLGRISYSVYLYQQLLVDLPEKYLRTVPFAARMAASVALIVLVASGSYYLVEMPFLRLKKRFERP